MNCDEVREQLEEYALGSLEPEERRAVAEHLGGCPACQQIASEYADLLTDLPAIVAAVSPHRLPSTLKERLLRQLEMPHSVSVSAPLVSAPQVHYGPQRVTLLPTRVRNGAWRLRLALALSSVLLLLLLLWSIQLNVALARERALRAEFSTLVDQQEIVLEVIDSNETTRRVLRSSAPNAGAYGKLFTRAGMPHVVMMAARLNQPAAGEAYHLWVTQDGQTELAGVLAINAEGFGLLVYDAAGNDPVYEAAQLTLQPIGSVEPVAPAVIQWQLPE